MSARFTFLAGPRVGKRVISREPAVTIGGGRAHTIYLPHLPTNDLLALVERDDDGEYRIAARDPRAALTVNSQPVAAARLREGDVIRLAGAYKIRFGVVPDRHEVCKSMRDIVRHSWRAAAQLDSNVARRAVFFLRDLGHCTACDAPRSTTLVAIATIVLLAGVALAGAVSLFQARAAEHRVVALSARVAAASVSRQELEREVARLRQLETERARAEARLSEVTQNLDTAERRLARLERQTPDLLAAIDAARQSVALVLVGFALFERASGKPLRFTSVDASGAPQPDENGTYPTSVDGRGPVAASFATGSGFLIDTGTLVTNRHVARPWADDPTVATAMLRGFQPRRTLARAYFPRLGRGVDLGGVRLSGEADIALVEIALPEPFPALTLAPVDEQVSPGSAIVLIGYPTGFDALLARADDAVARQITSAAGNNWPALAGALARRRLISPLVTLGHIGDVLEHNIIYDAATTHGGSGGPVLNAAGQVVAVNYAGLDTFAGARFGIPIRFVHRVRESRPKS